MTYSPEQCDESKFRHIFESNGCEKLLEGGDVEIVGMTLHNPPKNGIKQVFLEHRTSKDGTCSLTLDVYVSTNNQRKEFPVVLMLGDREYIHPYVPRPV